MSDLIHPSTHLGPNGWDKESLELALRARFHGDPDPPYVSPDRYYLDAEGKRAPEYAATHIRVRLAYTSFHTTDAEKNREPLDRAEEVVRRFAGVDELERLDVARGNERPQIVALIQRKPERVA